VWLLNALGLGVNALFFTYALISVPIHMALFRKMTNIPFTMLTIYLSYYFMMHEMAQIRAGVAAGCLLWAIYLYAEQKKTYALVAILAGTMFHYSAAAGLVLLLLGNGTTLPRWQKWALFAIVPVGLVAYFTHIDISYIIPEEMGGDKLMAYRELRDKGLEDEQAGWPLEQHLLIWQHLLPRLSGEAFQIHHHSHQDAGGSFLLPVLPQWCQQGVGQPHVRPLLRCQHRVVDGLCLCFHTYDI